MFFTLGLLIPFPMLFAVLMDSNIVKAKGVWKAILYMPALTSVVISGTLFRLMFTEYKTGQMNLITQALGLGTYKWLKNGWSGMLALLVLACWRWTGVNMLYFLSGLKAIDTSLYEAADIDGATPMQKFWYVTLPLLKPTTIYVLTISVYAGLSMFLESYMLWAGNSSPNNIGLTIVGYLYKRGIEKERHGLRLCSRCSAPDRCAYHQLCTAYSERHIQEGGGVIMAENLTKNLSHTPKHIILSILGTGFFVVLCGHCFPGSGRSSGFLPSRHGADPARPFDRPESQDDDTGQLQVPVRRQRRQPQVLHVVQELSSDHIVSVVLTLCHCYFVAYGLTMYDFKLQEPAVYTGSCNHDGSF